MYWTAIAAAANTAKEYGNTVLQDYFNRSNTSKATKQNVLFWQMQNEYNKPVNQMARLKEAGLNPNLIYGSVSNDAGAISTNIPHEAPQVPKTNAVSDYMNLVQQDAMTQQIEAQTSLLKAQADSLRLENTENAENGTSRATPYPIKVGKQVVNSIKKSVSSLAEPVSIQQSRFVDALQKKSGVNWYDGILNKFGGKDWNYGSKSLSEQRKIYQRDLVRQKGWSR